LTFAVRCADEDTGVAEQQDLPEFRLDGQLPQQGTRNRDRRDQFTTDVLPVNAPLHDALQAMSRERERRRDTLSVDAVAGSDDDPLDAHAGCHYVRCRHAATDRLEQSDLQSRGTVRRHVMAFREK